MNIEAVFYVLAQSSFILHLAYQYYIAVKVIHQHTQNLKHFNQICFQITPKDTRK